MKYLSKSGLALILVFAIGVLHAQTITVPPKAPAPIAIDGMSANFSWQLPETHFVAAKMPLRLVHPRPDNETNTWARHRNAYPGLEYRIPISVQGGAYPFRYEFIEGPSWLSISETVWDEDYGVLRGIAPVSPGSAEAVKLRVTDQELTTVDVEFYLTVTTEGFIFVDANVAESGDGTIGSPLKRFSELHGYYYPGSGSLGNPGTTAYSGTLVYLRGGVHQVADSPTPYISFSTKRPQTILGYPGENVEIDFTNGQIRSFGPDFFFGGITTRYGPNLNLVEGSHWSEADNPPHQSNSWLYALDGSWAMENGSRLFEPGGSSGTRLTFFEWNLKEHRGSAGNSKVHPSLTDAGNEGAIFTSALSSDRYRDYVTLWSITLQDIDTWLTVLYGTRYGVAEDILLLPDSGGPNGTTRASSLLFLKQQNTYWSVRRNKWTGKDLWGSAHGGLYLNVNNRRGYTTQVLIEAAYNIVHSLGDDTGRTINYNQSGTAVEDYTDGNQIWIYRNTLIGALSGFDRPYTASFDRNVMMIRNGNYPSSGTHRNVEIGEVDILDVPSNWQEYLDSQHKLKGSHRETFLGVVGHEIHGPVRSD